MRTRTLRKLRLPLLFAASALALRADTTGAQTCDTGVAARGAAASSLVDTMLNGSDAEDATFFTKSGGIPNIFFLLDNSGSMIRLPPNGPGFYPGTYPPLADPNCPAGGDPAGAPVKDPDCAYKTLSAFDADCPSMTSTDNANCPVIGCGDDDVSKGSAFSGAGTVIGWFRDRQFFPPCTLTGDNAGYYGARYGYGASGTFLGGDAVDYADLASECRYFAQGANAVRTAASDDKAGYDPDHYCGSDSSRPNLSCGGNSKPNLFDRYPVFHDSVTSGNVAPGAPGDGWNYNAVSPYVKSGGNVGTVSEFCSSLYTDSAMQGTEKKRDICSSCLDKRGFFFDGRLFRGPAQDGIADIGYASIWFKGNWLNFYPPKFVIARKILKDVVMDKVAVRMGMAHFGGAGADGTNDQWYGLKPTCDQPDSNWTSSRSTFLSQLDTYPFNRGTPIARALLDVGQYYHTPELPWFGHATTLNPNSGSTRQQSVCYACQASTVILITDGMPKSTDGNDLPSGEVTSAAVKDKYGGDTTAGHGILPTIVGTTTRTGGIPTTLCPACETFSIAEDWKNNPIRVAWYLHNMDLRKNDETTLDCRTMNGKQTLDIYTVGFATGALTGADTLLQSMAAMGGGEYVGAENPAALRTGIDQILTTIQDRTTSFSVATVSTLQTTAGRSVIVPRFDPDKENARLWRGHLFRYELFSEFLGDCTESNDGTGEGDLDCDGQCLSVFLQDADGDFISEDDSGIFRKNDVPDRVTCDIASACTGKTTPAGDAKGCTVAGTAEATAHWDAGAAITTQAWYDGRRIYTAVDDSGPAGSADGKIDRFDTTFRLEPTDTVAAKLMPYLRLGGAQAGEVCSTIANAIATRGDPDTAAQVRTSRTFCTKTLIRFVMGADVFNDNGAQLDSGVWPKAATDAGQNQLPERNIKLGDIFHSAPVVVDAPLPADGVLCKNGLHGQCLSSLWKTPTAQWEDNENAYDTYAKSERYRNRRKVILVGANDGLLHAFDGGTWEPDVDDTLTRGIDESLPPFNGYYTRGTGKELWALLPPDLIAKLPLLATGHQLFVDGSPMVRDVWVDGSQNSLTTYAAAFDGKKSPREFHTVAVVGERRGGTHYFALDITDATYLPGEAGFTAPKFLWLYPQVNDPESLHFGETYNDYLPSRPPIGPVRIAANATANGLFGVSTKSGTMETPDGDVDYHERWIAFLSGGFDPQGVRGRGVHMVDVWTGRELFDFSRPTGATACGATATDPRCFLRSPIAATVGMTMWGTSASANSSFGNDGFFDTATFGDTGGQLWTLRFSDPGTLDATTKKATNWYGGRAFQMTGCANQPFFYITANAQVPGGWLRTYAGTGDRYNLLDTYGGQCGPDNLRACAERGCTVTVAGSDANTLACTGLGRESSSLSLAACTTSNDNFYTSTARLYTSTVDACTLEGKANVSIVCGSGNSAPQTAKNRHYSCTDSADGLTCSYVTNSPGETLALEGVIAKGNWYFSIRVFDDGNRPIFRTPTEAESYDSQRHTVSSPTSASTGIVLIDGSLASPPALASASSAGWAMYFKHDGTQTVDGHTYPVSRYDERVSSTSALYGLLTWNTIQPALGAVSRATGSSCQVAKCTAENRRIAYHYAADPATGGSILRDANGNLTRSVASSTLVPAMGDQPTVFVNQKGQVQVAMTAVNPERGASNISAGVMKDPAPSFGVVPVSKDLHACRHSATQPAAGACK